MAAQRGKRTMPARPNLPDVFDEAPAGLRDLDSWEAVRVDDRVEVPRSLADVELIQSVWTGVDLTSRKLSGLRARDVVFDKCDLSGAVLDGARLDRVVFTGCRLTGTMLSATGLTDVVIEDCVANLGNFRAAKASYLFIERTVLTEADFYTARLADSAILDCDLTGANFSDTRTDGLALHGSTLERIVGAKSLAGARIDPDQLIPLGVALVAGLGISVGARPG